jgi:hypothetical protein
MRFIFEWKFTWDEIFQNEYLEDWENLYEQANNNNVFMHPVMAKVWIETYREIRNVVPLFCKAYKENKIVFFPLLLWRKNWKNAFQRIIVPIGHGDYDYTEPMLIGDIDEIDIVSFFEELVTEIKSNGIIFDEILVSCLRELYFSSKNFFYSGVDCPFIRIVDYKDIIDFSNKLPKKIKEDISKREKKLESLGLLKFTTIDDSTIANNYLPIFLAYYRERRPNAYIPVGFHEKLIKNAMRSGLLHLSVITLNEEVLSIWLAFKSKQTFYSYLPVFLDKYSKYSIGNIHRLETIRWAIENHFATYDLLRGKKEYKNKWSDNNMKLNIFSLKSQSAVSVLKRTLVELKDKIFKKN